MKDLGKPRACYQKTVGTKVTKEDRDRLEKLAKKNKTTVSWVLRRIIEEYFKENPL